MKLLLSFFLVLTYYSGLGQALQGRVLDAETGKPLEGASIYFNNSSIGSFTISDGSFSIQKPIDGELVISSIGYERIVLNVDIKEIKAKRFVFKLEKKEQSLEEIMIITDATRAEYLRYFRENFLGKTVEGKDCVIENLSEVYFIKPTNDSFGIVARSDVPLIVHNKKLGYKISFDLINFYYNGHSGISSFYGYTAFTDLDKNGSFEKVRSRNYLGSPLHFFRSLISGTLKENSFSLKLYTFDSTRKLGNFYGTIVSTIDGKEIMKRDTSNELYQLKWDGTLVVQYAKKQHVRVAPAGLFSTQPHHSPDSFLKLNGNEILVDKYGLVTNPMDMFTSGYWSMFKLGNMLPYNYPSIND